MIIFLPTLCEPLPEVMVCACRRGELEFANSGEDQDQEDDGVEDDGNEDDDDNDADYENDHNNT